MPRLSKYCCGIAVVTTCVVLIFLAHLLVTLRLYHSQASDGIRFALPAVVTLLTQWIVIRRATDAPLATCWGFAIGLTGTSFFIALLICLDRFGS